MDCGISAGGSVHCVSAVSGQTGLQEAGIAFSAKGKCEEDKMGADVQRVKPYEGPDPYIFVSYAHRDYERIDPILRELKARGYRFWYDEGIDPGTEWPENIARHLENSSVCLSFLSPYSAASNNCRREINFALSRNIPMLTVFLEDTKISPGLEMQISTCQSIMGYKYPDLAPLMERIVSVDVTEPCRGPAGSAASPGKNSAQWAPAAPKNRRTAPLIAAAVLVLAAAAAVFWFRNGGSREGNTDTAAEPAESAGSAAETAASSTSAPESGPGQIPEGFSAMILGKWDDGSVLLCGDGDKNVYIELTDDRIPYAYSFSEQPGNEGLDGIGLISKERLYPSPKVITTCHSALTFPGCSEKE